MSVIVTVKGKVGSPGTIPAHQWSGTQLRFQNTDGTWGSYQDLKGINGDPGPAAPTPQHEWSGTQLRFKNPDGSWGSFVELGTSALAPATKTTDYTLVAGDDGHVFLMSSTGNLNINVPNNLPASFTATIIRVGTGTVTVVPASGATNRSNYTKVANQYGVSTIYVFRNASNNAAEFLFRGDVSL